MVVLLQNSKHNIRFKKVSNFLKNATKVNQRYDIQTIWIDFFSEKSLMNQF